MKLVAAYVLVIFLANVFLTIGSLALGFVVSLLLAWLPDMARAKVAGVLGGVAGVAFAVAGGYYVFSFLPGADSYGLGPFLASALPLLIAVMKDHARASQLGVAEAELPESVRAVAAPATGAAHFAVLGYVIGLVAAFVWYFFLRNAA